ncbi:hypothetical protein SAMN05421770_11028 [Granulicella rosea]|uniref:Uncharacterized protein n=2 Tax=Granulicella rosea TaxID=474952 RepID=A0A239M5C9_9BACT|nr:hypothetical protein SAMN05421770_11028 [Granulicella rosea]
MQNALANRNLQFMKLKQTIDACRLPLLSLLLVLLGSRRAVAEPRPEAVAAFNSYAATVETRLTRQHRSHSTFLAPDSFAGDGEARLRAGELIIQQIAPPIPNPPGALLRHWRGAAFVQGAHAADFERLLRDFNAYPQRFAPQVLRAQSSGQGDHFQATMRVRQKHVITVVMDTAYDVDLGRLDETARYSASRSTHIYEIDSPGTPRERPLSPQEEHGFLWRLNTYWTYEERDGGLYIQIESISLSRSIPTGLGWAVRPFVESVPRESLEFTLRSASNAIRR